MKKIGFKFKIFALLLAASIFLTGCGDLGSLTENQDVNEVKSVQEVENFDLDEAGHYSDLERVALYLKSFSKLPSNYIKKSEAKALGWDSRKGNLWDLAEGMSIGGDRFGNREGKLPEKEGRIYYECDIDYQGGFRGPERIVYSNDGLIYYTADHYENFELIFGDDKI